MAPIYESDVAEERYSKAEWNHYELWEKVEVRLRRIRRLWIAGTVVLFLLLSAVPIVMDLRPKWRSLLAVRELAVQINSLKREASLTRYAYRIVFSSAGNLTYTVERAESCQRPGVMVRTGVLLGPKQAISLSLLDKDAGSAPELNLPGLVRSFCYDPMSGADFVPGGLSAAGFAVIPVNDLTGQRFDRLSLLVLSGPSAELSFE